MSTSKVTDFFKVQKGNGDIHPSKRRKLAGTTISSGIAESKPVSVTPPVSQRTRARAKVPQVQKTVTLKKTRQKKNSKSKQSDNSQVKIDEAFFKVENIDETPENSFLEEATAACDDHCASPPGTPQKRSSDVESDSLNLKRSRLTNAVRKDLLKEFDVGPVPTSPTFLVPKTPDRNFDFTKPQSEEIAARRKLVLKSTINVESQDEKTKVFQFTGIKKNEKSLEQGKIQIKEEVKVKVEVSHKQEVTSKDRPVLKLDKEVLKQKLQRSGKLAELKQKLAEFTEKQELLKSPIKKYRPKLVEPSPCKGPKTPIKLLSSTPQKAPAFERLESLASPLPPTLTLPFKYKQLLDKFVGMDTVVSMLYKRSEICTFSKLKSAVQEMTRKTFELKHVSQIKTVYPTAYTFRQEKGLPSFVNKVTGYQLTVEPLLEKIDTNRPLEVDKFGKPQFTATHLRHRKDHFHRNLICIVKAIHKEFLSSLERPLSIPDSKMTRWHPKFQLENVADVEETTLPQPPESSKSLCSAKAVLEQAKGNLHSRIQRTLELMCGEDSPKKNTAEAKTPKKDNASPGTPKKNNNSPAKLDAALKGVSSSLLEKIRAKEARKLEAAMMRSPEDEKRIQRMERLPELARILRTFFITQKKPALIEDDVIVKMADSYKSNLGKAETEKHLELLRSLVPDWITVVTIKKGRYLKIDKNKDIQVIQSRLQKLYTEQK